MALNSLNTEIDGYRSKAISEISGYQEYRDQVKKDPKLSPQGKQELITEVYQGVKERVAKIQQQEEAAVAARKESLQRSLVSRIGSNGADLVAMRDAEDRADRLEDGKEAMRVIDRAIRMDDRSLGLAVIRRANEAGWGDVVEKAAQAYPAAGEAIKDLSALHRYNNDMNYGLLKASTYSVGHEPGIPMRYQY